MRGRKSLDRLNREFVVRHVLRKYIEAYYEGEMPRVQVINLIKEKARVTDRGAELILMKQDY